MNFDIQSVTSCVMGLARKLIPGWVVTVELAPSIEANQGALAMVYSTPRRQMAHVVVAPHPPGESLEESIAHELTHSVLSPLTELIEWSPAAVMIEEQIVERLGKIIATAPTAMARAMAKALQNPRTNSPTVRKRISALAIGRRNGTRKRMDSKALAALAMEGGQIAAMEGLPPEAADWIKRAVEAMASGGDGPASNADPAMAKDPIADPEKQDGAAMRENELPPQMRKMMRQMQQGQAMLLRDAIRSRLHTARTVDGIVLDAETEKDLALCTTIEQFEREFKLVSRARVAAQETPRNRSGATPGGSNVNGAPSMESLVAEGMSPQLVKSIYASFEVDAETGNIALENARKRLPAKGGAK